MNSEELLKSGQIDEALVALKDEVRKDPADSRPRVFLFQLLCVLGDWDKALNQLNVACDLDPEAQLMGQVCRELLACEAFRQEVFDGKKTPLFLGEPASWVGDLVAANGHVAKGEWAAATELRERAFEAAPAVTGSVNGKEFEWIADGDTRLGPTIEAMIDGQYYWVPFENIQSLVVDAPKDLRDLVWAPATFRWTNEGEKVGFIPVRYPGSENHEDNAIKLGRSTFWEEREGGTWLGVGQRLLATDHGEVPVLEARRVLIGITEDEWAEQMAAQALAAAENAAEAGGEEAPAEGAAPEAPEPTDG